MRALLALVSSLLLLIGLGAREAPPPLRWWKGNTHTHTLWSDGDGAPPLVVDWYREHGYQFLVLSDHNQVLDGERWFPIGEGTRLTEERVAALVARFGADAIETREEEGARELRLWNLRELAARFERAGEFALVPGEEITSHFRVESDPPRDLPVHVNAVNLAAYVPPRGGASVAGLLEDTLAAVAAEERATGRAILAHLNHPNFGWGVTWQELAGMRGERFFEVYNGHRGVRNDGDAEHPSTERMWDLANTLRASELGLPLLYGLAVDDAHEYHGGAVSRPGRGWVMVRCAVLSGDELVRAMRRGEFYASSGVTLKDVAARGGGLSVAIAAEPGVAYTTRFVGTRRGPGGVGPAGEVLLETQENPARYEFTGDELFVRAVVTSSRDHPDPYRAGDKEQAWTQPVRP